MHVVSLDVKVQDTGSEQSQHIWFGDLKGIKAERY